MSSTSPERGIRFGAFEVDLQSGELRKHGVRIKLQVQPFKILVALLEKPGEVVSRDELRQRVWGNDTFVDFDHGLSAAVNRLRDALSDSAENPRYIETLARRGYRFVAPVEGRPNRAPLPSNSRRSHRALVWVAAVLLAATGAGIWMARDRGALPPARAVQLTSFSGTEAQPTFSPDGLQVAFAWDGERQENVDIYVKMVGQAREVRLTSDPAVDAYPAWSPDGRWIAFASSRGQEGIYLVSPLGGPERKVADLPATSRPSWSPDGKFLVVAGASGRSKSDGRDGALFLVPVGSVGDPRPILVPLPGTWYSHPAVANDGSLAFVSCTGSFSAPACQIQVVALDAESEPKGEPRRIAGQLASVFGLAWSPNRDALVFSANAGAGWRSHLWRVPAKKSAKPERLEVAGDGATFPAVDLRNNRLAFSRSVANADIWRLESGVKPSPFLTTTRRDSSPQFSPDGRRIAFESGRSGDEAAIWAANSDGTGWVQISRDVSPRCGTPRWSPDGKWIAFDAQGKDGLWDVWIIDASGGPARQLTRGPENSAVPSWSHDGRRVYFVSRRAGKSEIWRQPVDGGPAEPVTRNGGSVAFESADGKALYYTKDITGSGGLYSLQFAGGEERQVFADQVAMRGLVVVPAGVYYMTPMKQGPGRHEASGLAEESRYVFPSGYMHRYEIRFHEFSSGRSWTVAEIPEPVEQGLSVSPDRKTFLFSVISPGADLVAVENFR